MSHLYYGTRVDKLFPYKITFHFYFIFYLGDEDCGGLEMSSSGGGFQEMRPSCDLRLPSPKEAAVVTSIKNKFIGLMLRERPDSNSSLKNEMFFGDKSKSRSLPVFMIFSPHKFYGPQALKHKCNTSFHLCPSYTWPYVPVLPQKAKKQRDARWFILSRNCSNVWLGPHGLVCNPDLASAHRGRQPHKVHAFLYAPESVMAVAAKSNEQLRTWLAIPSNESNLVRI